LEYSQNDHLKVLRENVLLRSCWESALSPHLSNINALELQVICEGDTDVPVITDSFRLGIIFNNLISNAVTYADPAKANRFVKLTCRILVNGIQLTVSDNGCGIHKDYLSRVFDMFYRASNLSKGAGLGLYIVKQAVEKLGGVILIESEVGKGTAITITLPAEYIS
jgi:signal transduction histidine kinase